MRSKIENFFLWKWLLSIERFIMIFCSIAVVLTICGVVVCRYFLHINFAGNDEILVILALWLYFIGGLYGSYEDCHIKADVLSVFVKKESVLRITNVLIKVISLFISVCLAAWALKYLDLCRMIGGHTVVYKLPMMLSRSALVVGYVAPVLYNVFHLFIAIADLKAPATPEIEDNMTGGDQT